MSKPIEKIAIIGGGTAGWLTAAIVAAHHNKEQLSGIDISLVESSDIPTIGVGEGTWPTMKNTLYDIGLKESDIFKYCQAGFKQGGKFVGWVHGNGDYYYHPFTFPLGYGRLDVAPYLDEIHNFALDANFQQRVCEAGLAPRSVVTDEYQGDCNYAYHLDAGAFGEVLKQFCMRQLKVKQVVATVSDVAICEDGSIAAVIFESGQKIEADLFIDCTGFQSLLLGKELQVPFISTDTVLFNDSALALQIPYHNDNQPIASHTIATAQNAGWIWDIGLQNRRGVGHVYSSEYLSDDEAIYNLTQYLGAKQELEPRKINFKSGYRETFWCKNCVAVGLSAGFVEPLEATAIMLVEVSARYIAEHLPVDDKIMEITAKRFNQQMRYRWSRIVDFLKLHYVLNRRPETYWQRHRDPNTIPESLRDDLAIWQSRGPINSDFDSSLELFPAASYQYVVYGMEYKPNFSSRSYLYNAQLEADKIIARNQQLTQQYLNTLPPHRQFINQWIANT